ncbi:hypothetical protein M0L20_30005, partial [Spirosoma sp. RP8]
ASGLYSFTGLTPGSSLSYAVGFTAPSGYTATLANQGGDDTKDSDADPITGRTQSVTLAPGENNPTLDAGFYLNEICEKPVLTLGNPACTGTTSYSVALYSSTSLVTASAGSVDVANRRITNIPLGVPVSVTALSSGGAACMNISMVASPVSCSSTVPGVEPCVQPRLTVGQPICQGSTYSVSYTLEGVASLSVSGGSINTANHSIENIPVGVNVIVSAANSATCISSVTVVAPASCTNVCENPAISLSGPVCSTSAVGTYVVNYTLTAGATVRTSGGVAANGVISGVPSGVPLSLTVSSANGCVDKVVTVSPAVCQAPVCEKPVLTLGNPACTGTTSYSVALYSSTSLIMASAGSVDVANRRITGIPLGVPVSVTALSSGGAACMNISMVASPVSCSSTVPGVEPCVQPRLTVGQPICQGSTYSVSYTLEGVASLSVSGGSLNVVNHSIENIPVGTNVVVSALTSSSCISSVTVVAPASCTNVCENPAISLSGPVCSTSAVGTYVVNYTLTAGATVRTSGGVAANGVISGVPSGVPLSLTVSTANGCVDKVVVVSPASCSVVVCEKPVLTLGNPACTGTTSYSVALYSSTSLVTASAGSVDVANRQITGIPLGVPVSVTALSSGGAACMNISMVASPVSCSSTVPGVEPCVQPRLTVGQPICQGSTYSVSYTLEGVASLSVSGGSLNVVNHSIENIPVGTNVVVSALTSSSCISSVTVVAPASCTNVCENPAISLSGPVCSTSAVGTYVVNYTLTAGATVRGSAGVAANGVISGVPSGVPLSLTVSSANGCVDKVVTVSPASCVTPVCEKPVLTLGNPACTGATSYSVALYSSTSLITASVGSVDVANRRITNIPLGVPVSVTALSSGGAACMNISMVASPVSCSSTVPGVEPCVQPRLTVGQPICQGSTYSVSYTLEGVASLSVSGGSLNVVNHSIENIPVGTNVVVSALTSSSCISSVTVVAPASCTNVCENPAISLSGPVCSTSAVGTYVVNYTLTAGATVRGSAGVAANGVISGVPSGVPLSLTVSSANGCVDKVVTVSPANCVMPASLGDFVWVDTDKDGVQDAGEPGLPGVVVVLLDGNNTPIASTTTSATGAYSFTGLTPGVPYSVSFTAPSGYTATLANQGGDDTKDSDADPITGRTQSVTLAPGENNPT